MRLDLLHFRVAAGRQVHGESEVAKDILLGKFQRPNVKTNVASPKLGALNNLFDIETVTGTLNEGEHLAMTINHLIVGYSDDVHLEVANILANDNGESSPSHFRHKTIPINHRNQPSLSTDLPSLDFHLSSLA